MTISFGKVLILAVSIFFALNTFGQKKDFLIKNIREICKSINTDNTLKTVKLENEDFLAETTDGGGSLIGLFKGKKISKIQVSVGLSYGIMETEYYFANGRLIFVFEKEEDFISKGKQGDLDYSKFNTVFEERYYLDNGEPILHKYKGKRRFNQPSANLDQTVAESKTYLKLLQSHLEIGR